MSTPGDILRPLGMLEKLYTARQVLNTYNSVIVTATYALQTIPEDTILYHLFRVTIPTFLERHPSLCCYFDGENTPNPQFRGLRSINVKDVLQIVTIDKERHESLADILQRLHGQRWSTERKPLWKIVVLREGAEDAGDTSNSQKLMHVAFVYHHVIGDGLSGTAFHRSLLHALGEIERKSPKLQHPQPETIDTPLSIQLIEPIEKLCNLSLSWPFLLKQVLTEYAPRWLVGAPLPIWAGLPTQTLEQCPYRSRVRTVTIEADQVSALLAECRKHDVSLTSLITATLVFTLANTLPEATGFAGITPYTLRRVTGTSMDEMVNQSSGLLTEYSAESLTRLRRRKASSSTEKEAVENLWEAASYHYRNLQDELTKCPHDNLIGLLPYVADHVDYYRKKFHKPRETTWEVSNLGVFNIDHNQDLPPPQGWRLQSMTFTQGAQPLGSAFSVNCVTVKGGPLTIALTWQESIVDENLIDTLAHAFIDLPSFLSLSLSALQSEREVE